MRLETLQTFDQSDLWTKDKMTKNKTKKTRRQQRTKRQRPKIEFNIVMSGQFRTLVFAFRLFHVSQKTNQNSKSHFG